MNLNNESHFSQSPLGVDVKRSTFDRSTNWKGSSFAGDINCNFIDEILPGDTVDIKSTMLTRMTTPLTPVMDNCYIDQYFFFVPNRLVWNDWKAFCGETDATQWINTSTGLGTNTTSLNGLYTIPQVNVTNTTARPNSGIGDIAHQMGIPLVTQIGVGNETVSALPFRGYKLIYDEWFRSEDYIDPIPVNKTSVDDSNALAPSYSEYTSGNYFKPLKAARVHDYFGSVLPNTQKGAAIAIALGTNVPVYATSTRHDVSATADALTFKYISGGVINNYIGSGKLETNTGRLSTSTATAQPTTTYLSPDNLYAIGGNAAIDVEDLRYALMTQKVLEKLQIGGTRYVEFLKSMFGVTSPDGRQQRPELLGYSRKTLNMTEVTQMSEGTSSPLGTQGAMSKTIDDGCAFSHSFTEHGYLFGLFVIRHNRTYSQGINKMWTKKKLFDFYLPQLDQIGEQPVYTKELYALASPDDVFGYQEAWCEYKVKPAINTGLMDPVVDPAVGGLGRAWTYGDYYTSQPIMSKSYLESDATAITNTLAVQSVSGVAVPQFIHDCYISYKHTRPMSVYSVPGLGNNF